MKRKIFAFGMILNLIIFIILLFYKLYLLCLISLMLFIASFLFFLKKIIFISSRVRVNYLNKNNYDGMYYFIYGRQFIDTLDAFVLGMFVSKYGGYKKKLVL